MALTFGAHMLESAVWDDISIVLIEFGYPQQDARHSLIMMIDNNRQIPQTWAIGGPAAEVAEQLQSAAEKRGPMHKLAGRQLDLAEAASRTLVGLSGAQETFELAENEEAEWQLAESYEFILSRITRMQFAEGFDMTQRLPEDKQIEIVDEFLLSEHGKTVLACSFIFPRVRKLRELAGGSFVGGVVLYDGNNSHEVDPLQASL